MPILLEQIQASIEHSEFGLILHAQQQITTRRIKVAEIRASLLSDNAEVIEDYPEDPRGASCLVYGVVITAYQPDPARWMPDFKRRK